MSRKEVELKRGTRKINDLILMFRSEAIHLKGFERYIRALEDIKEDYVYKRGLPRTKFRKEYCTNVDGIDVPRQCEGRDMSPEELYELKMRTEE